MDVENRRKFFSEFAQSKGFDPLDFQQWNQFFAVDVIKHQVSPFSLIDITMKEEYVQ